MSEYKTYRTWADNGDAYVIPVRRHEAVDEVESEMNLGAKAFLVTRGDLTKDETLKIVEYIRWLVERSNF